jgi:hypothetical protein
MNQLWMVNSDGTNNRQLTVDEGLHEYPSISPDGKFIAYGLRPGSGIHYARHIHIISRDGKERREVTREDEVTYFPTWSPDGKWLSFTSRLITEPQDSFRAYYIDAHQQAVRRFIDRGWPIMWIDLDRLLIRKDMRTYIVSLNGTEKRQFYRDSTPAFPILNNKWIIYTDFRNNSSGTYIIRADDSTGHSLKKITQPIFINATDSEGKFFLYSKKPGEIWKVYLPDLSESRLPGKFPKIEINLSFHLGRDGKEFLYTKPHSIGKLVIIENPFR